jgi:hypothetical protein
MEGLMLMSIETRRSLLAAVTCFLAAITPTLAQTTWTQAGTLTCRLNPSVGFVLFGHQSMECKFKPVSGPVQGYDGAINTIGIDLGATAGGGFASAVFGPAAGLPVGALTGEYVGASADASFGLGAGANVLVGGSGRSVTLQPLSLQGSVGLNAVGGPVAVEIAPCPTLNKRELRTSKELVCTLASSGASGRVEQKPSSEHRVRTYVRDE